MRKKIGPCKTDFTWDPNCKGNFITLSENNLKININNDKEFIYRSILANKVNFTLIK